MGCKKTAVKVVKWIGKTVGPTLMRYVAEMVDLVQQESAADPTFWTDETKRRFVITAAKMRAKEMGNEASGSVLAAATEYAVVALKKAGAAVEEIGDDDFAEELTETV